MLKVAVLVSGGGTNLQAILDAIDSGRITNAEVSLVISNNPNAYALERAKNHGIEAVCISPKEFEKREEFHKALLKKLQESGAELIVLAGYLVAIPPMIVEAFPNKIINIHPSLLPAFRGAHAIDQALEYGVKVFGVTIHYVDATLDGGKIISQRAFGYDGDDIAELEARIHAVEYPLYIETINKLLKE
mgnify:CR=1 FL=1